MDIKSVDLKQILDNVSNYPGLKTIVKNGASMKNTLGEVGQAAGQKRRAGRILFAANCNKYLSALKGQYNKVKSLTNKDEVNIHIFTGLAGGTGSGAIIDVVAQTRAQETYKHANIWFMPWCLTSGRNIQFRHHGINHNVSMLISIFLL